MEVIEHHRRAATPSPRRDGWLVQALAWPEAAWLAVVLVGLITLWGWQSRPLWQSQLHLLCDLLLAVMLLGHARRHRQDLRTARDQGSQIEARTRWLDAVSGLSPDAVLVFERDGEGALRLVFTNPAFSELFGLRPVELIGLSEAATDEWLAGLALDRTAMPALGLGETTFELAGPPPRVLRRSAREEGQQRVYYFRDVTHETAVERLKSEFVTTAAHELRTPMASVYGFSELLLDRSLPDERRHRLNLLVHRQAGVLKHLIDQLLTLSQLDARAPHQLVRHPQDLGAQLRLACEIAGATEPDDRLRLRVEGSAWVDGDGELLVQALLCLIGNALKYSRAPAPVHVACTRQAQGGRDGALIEVRDTGIGMGPADLERACERFFRADASGHVLGAGLGLPIAQAIIEAHGGTLSLLSQLGQGCQARVWLPLGDTPADQAAGCAPPATVLTS